MKAMVPYDQLPLAEKALVVIVELDKAASRFTRYSNDPVDGLLDTAARLLEEFCRCNPPLSQTKSLTNTQGLI